MTVKSPSNNKNSSQSRRRSRFHLDLSLPMIFCVVEAAVLFAILAIVGSHLQNKQTLSTMIIVFSAFYVLSAGFISLSFVIKDNKIKKAQNEARKLETEIYDMFRYIIDFPYAIVDGNGKVKLMNGALQDILGYKSAISGIDLSEFCSVSMQSVIAIAKSRDDLGESSFELPETEAVATRANITHLSDGRRYEIEAYIFKMHGENYYFTVFNDIENLLSLAEKEKRESPVVAYVMLDNLNELAQYVRADYSLIATEVETLLKSWVADMKGFIKAYDSDRFIAVFSKQELDKQMQNDFDIQNKIMSLKIGDNSFPITVSMGIAAISGSLREKEMAAFEALDIAIKRGGNQIAIRREDSSGYSFFGGTHKTIENNTAVVSRVSGEILEKKIRGASEVLIMGHSSPDFDSIGSCVGAARFAMSVIDDEHKQIAPEKRPTVKIVIDKNNDAFRVCREQLAPLNVYDEIFISRDAARDLVSADTVLIICDVNNPYIYEAADLTQTISDIAILDHHRLANALTFEPFLQYVEATKSSASEIVAEILLRSKFSQSLLKEEAEVLLSGIMLDTNNFTRNAGAQTFEITHYLYSRGAHTTVVREFFNETLEELLLTGEFESKAKIYRDHIAITGIDLERPASPEDRVVASKVADKLLRIKDVEASFALVRMNNDVVISGRSKGKINVQLILEKLKGGGHFDVAGAQVKNSDLAKVRELLTDAIDDYFEFDHSDGSDAE
ncbi:MAG: hypothetical protein E7592_04555 [Ruminococcaceae bacterium]|nr:hypothetical protein [Oscillospiraceae bacterium]